VKIGPAHLKAHYNLAEAYFAKASEARRLKYEEKQNLLKKASRHYSKIMVLSPRSKTAQKAMDRLMTLQAKLKQETDQLRQDA